MQHVCTRDACVSWRPCPSTAPGGALDAAQSNPGLPTRRADVGWNTAAAWLAGVVSRS